MEDIKEKIERNIDSETIWLIDNFRTFCAPHDDSYNLAINGLTDNGKPFPEYAEILKNSQIINIGCGHDLDSAKLSDFLFKAFKISKYLGVDPYSENLWDLPNKEKIDGLGYLVKQSDNSANIITFGLDTFIIQNKSYAEKLVGEIFRVVPEDGIYLSSGSTFLEIYADKLFPIKNELGYNLQTYMKKPTKSLKVTDALNTYCKEVK
ncbi:MAG: hypothetical protein ACOYT4_00575 [Nanoarchaeota archaeon]